MEEPIGKGEEDRDVEMKEQSIESPHLPVSREPGEMEEGEEMDDDDQVPTRRLTEPFPHQYQQNDQDSPSNESPHSLFPSRPYKTGWDHRPTDGQHWYLPEWETLYSNSNIYINHSKFNYSNYARRAAAVAAASAFSNGGASRGSGGRGGGGGWQRDRNDRPWSSAAATTHPHFSRQQSLSSKAEGGAASNRGGGNGWEGSSSTSTASALAARREPNIISDHPGILQPPSFSTIPHSARMDGDEEDGEWKSGDDEEGRRHKHQHSLNGGNPSPRDEDRSKRPYNNYPSHQDRSDFRGQGRGFESGGHDDRLPFRSNRRSSPPPRRGGSVGGGGREAVGGANRSVPYVSRFGNRFSDRTFEPEESTLPPPEASNRSDYSSEDSRKEEQSSLFREPYSLAQLGGDGYQSTGVRRGSSINGGRGGPDRDGRFDGFNLRESRDSKDNVTSKFIGFERSQSGELSWRPSSAEQSPNTKTTNSKPPYGTMISEHSDMPKEDSISPRRHFPIFQAPTVNMREDERSAEPEKQSVSESIPPGAIHPERAASLGIVMEPLNRSNQRAPSQSYDKHASDIDHPGSRPNSSDYVQETAPRNYRLQHYSSTAHHDLRPIHYQPLISARKMSPSISSSDLRGHLDHLPHPSSERSADSYRDGPSYYRDGPEPSTSTSSMTDIPSRSGDSGQWNGDVSSSGDRGPPSRSDIRPTPSGGRWDRGESRFGTVTSYPSTQRHGSDRQRDPFQRRKSGGPYRDEVEVDRRFGVSESLGGGQDYLPAPPASSDYALPRSVGRALIEKASHTEGGGGGGGYHHHNQYRDDHLSAFPPAAMSRSSSSLHVSPRMGGLNEEESKSREGGGKGGIGSASNTPHLPPSSSRGLALEVGGMGDRRKSTSFFESTPLPAPLVYAFKYSEPEDRLAWATELKQLRGEEEGILKELVQIQFDVSMLDRLIALQDGNVNGLEEMVLSL